MGSIQRKQSSDEAINRLGHSFKEAENITGLCRTTLWKAINAGKLKSYKVGRRVLFSPDHLKEFLEAHERCA
jgi:excisionase family DNA binding protein